MTNKIQFSLSPSSINLYKFSQLLFYYSYIAKMPPDTKVVECYGLAGNLTHDVIEKYSLGDVKDVESYFTELWHRRKLDKLPGMNGKPLSIEIYKRAALKGKKLIDTKYKNSKPEESIIYPLYKDNNFDIRIKGIIDLQAELDGKHVIVDWKTSSNVDGGESFRLQGLYYSMLVYKKYNRVPEQVIFEYVKINKTMSYVFTKEEIEEFEKYLLVLAKEIASKGIDIKNYDVGNEEEILSSPFNGHLEACKEEIKTRQEKYEITARLKNNKLFFESMPKKLVQALEFKYSYYVPGYNYSKLYKNKHWNGKKCVFSKKLVLPYPLINDFYQLLVDFNKYYNTQYYLNLIDERNLKIINATYNTKFVDNNIKLRYYQEEAVKVALEKKIGILFLGTGAGKSIIAAELIKKLNRRTLFLVNRLELVTQTREVFEDYLGVNIGEMSEGNLDIKHQITVASIQTIHAILKRNDETSKQLKTYLANVTLTIYDEAQNLNDEGIYGVVSSHLQNNVYSIGLSGSPWRTA